MRNALLRFCAAAGILAAAAAGHAETHDPRTVTLGWMTEHADAVVAGRAAEERLLDGEGQRRELDLLVDDSIRGGVAAGTTLVVAFEGRGEAPPWRAGARHLAFLRALPAAAGAPPRWGPVSGSFGIRPIPAEGPESRFPSIVRGIASLLDAKGAVARPAELREALVAGMEDEDPGVAWSSATDFVRHAALHEGIPAEQARRVVAAFRRQPVGKETKRALALAVAATGDPLASRVLVDALDDPRGRLVRGAVGEALRRLRDPGAAGLLLARLEEAGPAKRADLLQVLGAVGAVEGAGAARKHLSDADPGVRVEAAHALGLLARAAREADPGARTAGRAELAALASAEGAAESEARAALWALGQLDEEEAWAALRSLAAGDPRDGVRRYAARILRNPRQSLILE